MVGQVCLRFCRVDGFQFSGVFRLGYMLGLVTVVQRLGFLGFRVVSRLGLARFFYGWVRFRVFQLLEVFCGQGISQGQLLMCRVQVFEGLEWFCTQGFQCFLQFLWFRGFFRVQNFFGGQGIAQGRVRVSFFYLYQGFFLEIITFNVFSGTFYARVDCC